MDKLQQAISALLYSEPFYGHLISRMKITKTLEIPSAGVFIDDKINLLYNHEWLEKLELIDVVKVLKHECAHILQEHIPRAKQIGASEGQFQKRFNIATDATINIADLIPTVKKIGGVTIDSLNEMFKNMIDEANAKDNAKRTFIPMEKGKLAEYYYNRINQFANENPDLIEKEYGSTIDDHSTWDKSEANEELIREVTRKNVNDSVNACGGIGNVPSNIASIVNQMNESQINWRKQLRQACVTAQKSLREPTRKKRNRRYGILQPGFKRKPKLKIVVPVDTSMSMAGEPLKHAWYELSSIYASSDDLEITVIEADCVIQDVYEFNPNKIPQFKGAGGTSYGPALKKAKELKADLIIYIGDMDSADTPENPKIPVIWCVTGTSKPPADFGRAIYVDIKK